MLMGAPKLVYAAVYSFVFLAIGVSVVVLGPTLLSVKNRTGADMTEMGALLTAFAIGQLLAAVWAAKQTIVLRRYWCERRARLGVTSEPKGDPRKNLGEVHGLCRRLGQGSSRR